MSQTREDVAHPILTRGSRTCTGNVFIDEEVPREEEVEDLTSCAVDPEAQLQDDLLVAGGSAAEELPQGDPEAG